MAIDLSEWPGSAYAGPRAGGTQKSPVRSTGIFGPMGYG